MNVPKDRLICSGCRKLFFGTPMNSYSTVLMFQGNPVFADLVFCTPACAAQFMAMAEADLRVKQ